MPRLAIVGIWEQAVILLVTTLIAFAIGFAAGVFKTRGNVGLPKRRSKRREKLYDAMESDETDVEDELVLDHAPNWANSEDDDYRQGLRL
ncbi:hypothetical protein G6O67_000637 [Ophiocordyceps sinensis]|uniref:Uncharacterized protein n=2 Tax=Ophiocordyceps sinensis TaxID=72228 RepID=A0A8H4PZK5_9HYPO|nr:hypothetical protein OCS_02694 [Ophiocordyceps sinensis CO18]KAF4513359.1 hypothetical protein G6O67_000637 [Ophiocordyceps sinensis]